MCILDLRYETLECGERKKNNKNSVMRWGLPPFFVCQLFWLFKLWETFLITFVSKFCQKEKDPYFGKHNYCLILLIYLEAYVKVSGNIVVEINLCPLEERLLTCLLFFACLLRLVIGILLVNRSWPLGLMCWLIQSAKIFRHWLWQWLLKMPCCWKDQ